MLLCAESDAGSEIMCWVPEPRLVAGGLSNLYDTVLSEGTGKVKAFGGDQLTPTLGLSTDLRRRHGWLWSDVNLTERWP